MCKLNFKTILMTVTKTTHAVLISILCSACSLNNAQEFGYFVVQNMAQLQCLQRINDNCQSQSYDYYQAQRRAVNQAQTQ